MKTTTLQLESCTTKQKISTFQIEMVSVLGELCEQGEITFKHAVLQLSNKYGMNKKSAQYYMQAYQCMRRGVSFAYTINAKATLYFLNQILLIHGKNGAVLALRSLELHLRKKPSKKIECIVLEHS